MPTGNKELKKSAKAEPPRKETKKGGSALDDAKGNKNAAKTTKSGKNEVTATLTKQQRKKVFNEEKLSKEERKKMLKEERAATVVKTIEEAGYTAVVRAYEKCAVKKIIDMYIRGGLKVIEIATSCPQFTKTIREVRASRPEVTVGVGQCISVAQCKSAVAAGAQFIVTPNFDEAVVKAAVNLCVPIMPGCSTPSEMHRAHELGCTMQKLFSECTMPVVLQSVGRSAPACVCDNATQLEAPAELPVPEPVVPEEKVKNAKVIKKKKKKKLPDYDSGGEEE